MISLVLLLDLGTGTSFKRVNEPGVSRSELAFVSVVAFSCVDHDFSQSTKAEAIGSLEARPRPFLMRQLRPLCALSLFGISELCPVF